MSDNTTPNTSIVVSEATFSTNFKLFAPDGTQMQFTCRVGTTHAEHLAALEAYRAALIAEGYANEAPVNGTEEGEKAEEVAAYVRGTTKAGQPLVWLYSAKAILKWRLTTVYEEHLAELPFTPAGLVWPGNAAPERDEATAKGYLQELPAFKIVLAENGQTEDGKAKWKYARIYGAPAAPASNGNGKSAAAPAPAANGNGNGHAPAHAHGSATPAPVNGNGNGHAAAAPTNGNGNDAATAGPACPKCGGAMWDNRAGKRNPAAPDYKCRDKACDGAIWPPKNGNGAAKTAAPATAPAPSGVPF